MAMTVSMAGSVWAHSDDSQLDEASQAARQYRFELTAKAHGAVIHVKNNETDFSAAGVTDTLTVLDEKGKMEIALQPAGANVMEAKGNVKLTLGTRVASIIFADQTTITKNVIAK